MTSNTVSLIRKTQIHVTSDSAPALQESHFRVESASFIQSNLTTSEAQMTFSAAPTGWISNLDIDYENLEHSLQTLTEFGVDEWQIDKDVYEAAHYIAAELMAASYPTPQIVSHGSRSIVFDWSNNKTSCYLTVSANRISALTVTLGQCQRRVDYSINELKGYTATPYLLKAVFLQKPVRFQRQIRSGISSVEEASF